VDMDGYLIGTSVHELMSFVKKEIEAKKKERKNKGKVSGGIADTVKEREIVPETKTNVDMSGANKDCQDINSSEKEAGEEEQTKKDSEPTT